MDSPEECKVCFSEYNDESRPRTLPCGHTFCSSCIADIIDNYKKVPCPTCRTNHDAKHATEFPISYITEAFITKQKQGTQAVAPQQNKVPDDGKHKRHKIEPLALTRKQKLLKDAQMDRLKSMAAEVHRENLKLNQYIDLIESWKSEQGVLVAQLLAAVDSLMERNKGVLKRMDREVKRIEGLQNYAYKVRRQMQATSERESSVKTIEDILLYIDQTDLHSEQMEEWREACVDKLPNVKTVTSCLGLQSDIKKVLEIVTGKDDDNIKDGDADNDGDEEESSDDDDDEDEFVSSIHFDSELSVLERVGVLTYEQQLNIEDLRKMDEPVKQLVQSGLAAAVDGEYSAKLSYQDDRLYLHCLDQKTQPPFVRTLPYSEVLELLDKTPSDLVFLDLAWGHRIKHRVHRIKRRVHIRLNLNTALGKQFTWLCTGQKHCSYLNTILLELGSCAPSRFVLGGDFEFNDGTGKSMLVDEVGGKYLSSSKAGCVFRCYRKSASQFAISIEGARYGGWTEVYGQVESGLAVIQDAAKVSDIKKVTVVDCGIIVPL